MTSLPTYEVDSPTLNVSSPTPQNTVPLLPLHAYQLFLVLWSTVEPNKPLNMCTQNLTPYNLFLVLSSTCHTTYSLFFHPHAIQLIPCSFIHMPYNLFLVLSSTRHTTYSLFFHPHAIQLIPCSFIHCRAKRKSILDIRSRSDWHISIGELTFDIGESTSSRANWSLAKWLVGETTGIRSASRGPQGELLWYILGYWAKKTWQGIMCCFRISSS